MSIEQALAENTAAIKELIAVSKQLHDLRVDAIEKVGAAAATATKAAASKETKETKETKKADEPKANISSGSESRENPYEGIKELIAGYLSGTDRPEERDARKAKVVALLNHEKIKKPEVASDAKPDAANIMEDAIPLFKDQIAKLVAKGDLTEAPKKASDDLDL